MPCLNMAQAICWRQKGRQGVTRIQLFTWLDSLGNTSYPHGLKHAKLSAVSDSSLLPADWQPQCRCGALPEWRTTLGHAGRGEMKRAERGKESQKGRGSKRGQSRPRERKEKQAQLIYGSRSAPKHTCDTNAQGQDRCRSECWVATCHAPILQFTSRETNRGEIKFALQIVRWVNGDGVPTRVCWSSSRQTWRSIRKKYYKTLKVWSDWVWIIEVTQLYPKSI